MDLEKGNDMNDIKNCLKDAGLFEENMDPKVMLEYYSAIKNSQNTASEEDEIRKNNIQSSDSKNSDTHQSQKIKTMKFEESDHEEPDETHSTELFFNFCDMPTLSEKMLEVIHHEPKYHLAVNFYSGSYKQLNLKQKVSLLYKYHTDLNKKIATFAKKSIYPTPRGKDILASNKFCGSLLKNSFDMNDDFERSDGSLYISRSGRQMKRKKYTEDFDFDDEFQDNFYENKKMKDLDDNEWRLKRTRGADKKNAIQINNNNNNDEISKAIPRKQSQQNIESSTLTPNEIKRDYSTPLSKRNSLRKLSNDEIMKRSSLFSPVTVKKTRSEAMFDKLREEEHKKSLQEMEVQLFKDSLKDIESEEPLESESKMQITESPIVSKKSPVGRRAINTRKRTTQEEPEKSGLESGKKISKNASKAAGEGTSLARNLTFTKEDHLNSSLSEQNAGQSADTKKIECPLCGEAFPEEDIQEHAATCCDPSENIQIQRSSIDS